ncbi:hypothetical protein EV361DRAFT_9340 [Lentinula raphanica]|nr:hypothetical protein EV361DRAFT_9340 [Lentinula raphanica]
MEYLAWSRSCCLVLCIPTGILFRNRAITGFTVPYSSCMIFSKFPISTSQSKLRNSFLATFTFVHHPCWPSGHVMFILHS